MSPIRVLVQIQATNFSDDGSVTITPKGLTSAKSDTLNTLTNVALGNEALATNSSGFNNTAIGSSALNDNTTGYHNTVILPPF